MIRLRDIMSTSVQTTTVTESAEAAYERLKRRKIHHLVVVDQGRVVGVLSERDLGGARGAAVRRDRTVVDLMSANTITAPPDATLLQAASAMRGRSIGCLPIVDDGKLVGIVTLTDLLETVGRGAERPISRRTRWSLRTEPQRWTRGPSRTTRGVR